MLRVLKRFTKQLIYRPKLGAIGKETLILLPRKIFNKERVKVGDRVIIYGHAIVYPLLEYEGFGYNGQIIIGDDVYIGKFCQLIAMNRLTIGNGSVLSEYVYINDSSHGLDPKEGLIMKQPLNSKGEVSIGQNCFLGFGVKVMPGVALGDWCIVGAGSIVTKSFPPYSMIAGSPARLIKQYSVDTESWIVVGPD